jgi:beta-hydroxylase
VGSQSTIFSPLSTLFYLSSAVPNRPFLDRSAFPELGLLEQNWDTIREEARALLEGARIRSSERLDDLGFNSFFRRGWKRFYLRWYGDFLPSAQELCPKTVGLLEQVPCVKAAMFALMSPGTKLVKHRDPYAGALRYHLGLITPNSERCRISVDGEPYFWRDGEGVLFDPTFVHHARNETDETRVILFCDVERPMRNRVATAVNRFLIRHFMTATATRNVDGEKVGLLNRTFGYISPLRALFKWMKRKSKRGYYALKFVFLGGLVALFFWLF